MFNFHVHKNQHIDRALLRKWPENSRIRTLSSGGRHRARLYPSLISSASKLNMNFLRRTFAYIYSSLQSIWGWFRLTSPRHVPLDVYSLEPLQPPSPSRSSPPMSPLPSLPLLSDSEQELRPIRRRKTKEVHEFYQDYYENPLRRSWDGRELLHLD